YSTVNNSRGLTAEQVARRILDSNGLNHIGIERISGSLTDHFSPAENVVRLSDSVYGKTSVAAIGVAAHECGHACQHAESYAPIVIRSKIVPVVNICSRFWYLAFILGFIISHYLVYIGIAMFGAVVIFQLVTLPTELDASNRALKTLEGDGILEMNEVPQARKVLTAAAMTYVTSLVVSIMQLLRLIARVKND
ncbi:MAG: zinc metallopeptidase, partial [Ruminococcus sp.]|nr:zinc metallopeptidase [Ruminococcus sp.]